MHSAYKYRLYPNAAQRVLFAKHFGCARWAYNYALALKMKTYEKTGKTLSQFDLMREFPKLKKQEETAWLSEVCSHSLQCAMGNLDIAYTKFFREKKGFPKFKSKRDHKSYSTNVSIDVGEDFVSLPKVGKVGASISRPITGRIQRATVSQTATGKYFVSIACTDDNDSPEKKRVTARGTVGIDLGITHFCTISLEKGLTNPYLDLMVPVCHTKTKKSDGNTCGNMLPQIKRESRRPSENTLSKTEKCTLSGNGNIEKPAARQFVATQGSGLLKIKTKLPNTDTREKQTDGSCSHYAHQGSVQRNTDTPPAPQASKKSEMLSMDGVKTQPAEYKNPNVPADCVLTTTTEPGLSVAGYAENVIPRSDTPTIPSKLCKDSSLTYGVKIANPRYLTTSLRRLARSQRVMSRRKPGSNNRHKQKRIVARIHEKIVNRRRDFQHKLSTRLIRENQAVAIESLNVSGMQQNPHIARAISDAGWAQFVSMLDYKAERYGKTVLRIGRFEPSSKLCSCGVLNDGLKLSDRVWTCEACGVTHDRDVLAANNIKRMALHPQNQIRSERPELTLGETTQ